MLYFTCDEKNGQGLFMLYLCDLFCFFFVLIFIKINYITFLKITPIVLDYNVDEESE